MSKLTIEQQDALNTILDPNVQLVKVSARAGSGKTHLLVEIAKSFPKAQGLYLAYNKSIADESKHKFPKNIQCSTTHSLAYRAIVPAMKLKVGFIRAADIKYKAKYEIKILAMEMVKLYCLSDATSIDEFIKSQNADVFDEDFIKLCKSIFSGMQSRETDCTHEFYLKLYHLALHNKILELSTDLLMLDEAGDINPVTLAIFKLINSPKKILVGDNHQNIYGFNNTINGFEALEDEGVLKELTQSFRVSKPIARGIESFCQDFLCDKVRFIGIDHSNEEIKTKAYLFRTNASLISKMIDLNKQGTKYNLARDPSTIFKLPMLLLSIKPDTVIFDPQYKHLNADIKWFFGNQHEILKMDPDATILKTIASNHSDDLEISSACRMIFTYNPFDIITANKISMDIFKSQVKYPLTLSTAHSSKG